VKQYHERKGEDEQIAKLSAQQQEAVVDFLMQGKQDYLAARNEISNFAAKDPEYSVHRSRMNNVVRGFEGLKDNLDKFKQDKLNYVKNVSDRLVSRATTPEQRSILNDIYLSKVPMKVDGGSLAFGEEGKEVPYNSKPRYITKDYNSANQILQMASGIYQSRAELKGARKVMVENQIRNMVRQGGRDTLLSLATDDFITHGGLGPIPPHYFDPKEEDTLFGHIVNNYMSIMQNTALTGHLETQKTTDKVVDKVKSEDKAEDILKVQK
jgi:hypothetical protein